MDNLKEPYVTDTLVDYLDRVFSVDAIMQKHLADNSDRVIGYIWGVRDIIGHLRMLKEEQEEREEG